MPFYNTESLVLRNPDSCGRVCPSLTRKTARDEQCQGNHTTQSFCMNEYRHDALVGLADNAIAEPASKFLKINVLLSDMDDQFAITSYSTEIHDLLLIYKKQSRCLSSFLTNIYKNSKTHANMMAIFISKTREDDRTIFSLYRTNRRLLYTVDSLRKELSCFLPLYRQLLLLDMLCVTSVYKGLFPDEVAGLFCGLLKKVN